MAKSSGGGLGCSTILFLIFLVLKLTGNIAWSWLWVFSPLWFVFFVVVFSIAALAGR